jgi:hypothetical protein
VSATVYSAIGDSRSDSTPAELKGEVSNAQEPRLVPVDAIWKVVAAGELEEEA